MDELSKKDLNRIVALLSSHSVNSETANVLVRAVNASFANFSNAKRRMFSRDDKVVITHGGKTYDGIVEKVGPKNLIIRLASGARVKAHPSLCEPGE